MSRQDTEKEQTTVEYCSRCEARREHVILLRTSQFNETRCTVCGWNNIDTAARLLEASAQRGLEDA
jgi:hypothetical protein